MSHMANTLKQQVQALVDLETTGWNTRNPDLFLSIIHSDMVWPWPPTADAHDPVGWVFVLGRFDRERWRVNWQDIFNSHDLVHNRRDRVKIEVSREQDAAFAVVDIDTLWRHKKTKEDFHWKGRVCKVYTKMPTGEWKFIFQTGPLDYSKINVGINRPNGSSVIEGPFRHPSGERPTFSDSIFHVTFRAFVEFRGCSTTSLIFLSHGNTLKIKKILDKITTIL